MMNLRKEYIKLFLNNKRMSKIFVTYIFMFSGDSLLLLLLVTEECLVSCGNSKCHFESVSILKLTFS